MDKQQLIIKLIRVLEREKGAPVQIIVDTPKTVNWSYGDERTNKEAVKEGREYFGKLDERLIEVKRVEGLDPKYEHDVALLEGSYTNLGELQRKIEHYVVLGTPTEKQRLNAMYQEMINRQKELNKSSGFEVPETPLDRLDAEENIGQQVQEILTQTDLEHIGIEYLQHRILARADGLFDFSREIPRQLTLVDRTKIADITLKLLE